jgi:hypothetical protein
MSIFSSTKIKIVVLALLVLGSASIFPSSTYAKTKNAKYGTIKILSNPGGLPISINGKSYGTTTTEFHPIDLDAGIHRVVITLPNGQLWTRQIELPAGRVKCIAVNYRPLPPVAKSPCPFPVNISAPSQVTEGEIITFTSDVSYGGNDALTRTWTVSPQSARVLSGAGTPTITVDSTGLAGQQITATLVVTNGSDDPTCRQSVQANTYIPPHEKRTLVGREFDTCCSCSYDDQKARLDTLAVELQNDPTATAYLFAYGGRTGPTGQADKLLVRARDYLINDRKIDASRLVMSVGGYRETDCVEVWLVPQGAAPPRPSPTVQPGEVKPANPARPRKTGRGI